jgi:nitrogen fixation protein NifQ
MDAASVYSWLMEAEHRPLCDGFDAHVVATTLSLALVEAVNEGQPLCAGTGLERPLLLDLVTGIFPHARDLLVRLDAGERATLTTDEACLRELLTRYATEGSPLERHLAAIVACRAQRPNHLWQDLGLRHRRELSWLMSRHFEPLASRNRGDMRWKKFLYRTICRDNSFSMCFVPSCSECSDYDECFGEERGQSLLAASPVSATAAPVAEPSEV